MNFESQISALFDTSLLNQFSKFNSFLWVCWFLWKNLSNFVPPSWNLHNPYCHCLYAWENITEPFWDHRVALEWNRFGRFSSFWDIEFNILRALARPIGPLVNSRNQASETLKYLISRQYEIIPQDRRFSKNEKTQWTK